MLQSDEAVLQSIEVPSQVSIKIYGGQPSLGER